MSAMLADGTIFSGDCLEITRQAASPGREPERTCCMPSNRSRSTEVPTMKPARLLLAALAAATFAAAAQAEPDRLVGLTLSPLMMVEQATGPAASAGIQPGDRLVAVDGIPLQDIKTLEPFEHVTGSVALLVQRGDETFYVPVLLDNNP